MEKILDIIPNRYEAVRVIAKEARRINQILVSAGEEIEEKPTTVAMKRLMSGKVKFAYEQREEEK
jgi:DNA-directed RNA polymerase omega subunit